MALTLDQLSSMLHADLYTPRTEEQLKTEAENKYTSIYNQKKLTAQQSAETTDQAYQRQLQSLQDTLAQDQQTLTKNTADNIASANRYMITRGMQRSSYAPANQARLQTVGQNNLTALLKQFETDRGEVESDRTLLARQLADTLAQYDIDYLSDVQAYIEEQKQIDYEREQAALKNKNDILMALYEYGQAAAGRSSGGSSRRRSSGGSSSSSASSSSAGGSLWDSLSSSTASNLVAKATAGVQNVISKLKSSSSSSSGPKGETNRDSGKTWKG